MARCFSPSVSTNLDSSFSNMEVRQVSDGILRVNCIKEAVALSE